MGSGWLHISSLPFPYPYFEIGENPNSYPNPVKPGKTRQIGVGLGGYPWAQVLLSCLVGSKNYSFIPLFDKIYIYIYIHTQFASIKDLIVQFAFLTTCRNKQRTQKTKRMNE
jgi:hypothetical protein